MSVPEMVEQYLAAGLPVLPLHTIRDGRCTCKDADCRSQGKHPLTRHGKDDATLDPDTVAGWLARWPGCNVGVRPPVGVVVLDIDPRNGGDVNLAALQEKHTPLPHTLTCQTGSGGLHHWLSYNGPTRGKLCEGVDVKSNGGYLVAPPSIHLSGGTYEWITEAPAAYAPQWVKDILNPPRRLYASTAPGNIEPLVRFVASATEGERNRMLFWAACRAVEKGLDTSPLIDAAVSVGQSLAEATATVNSAHNAPRKASA